MVDPRTTVPQNYAEPILGLVTLSQKHLRIGVFMDIEGQEEPRQDCVLSLLAKKK